MFSNDFKVRNNKSVDIKISMLIVTDESTNETEGKVPGRGLRKNPAAS